MLEKEFESKVKKLFNECFDVFIKKGNYYLCISDYDHAGLHYEKDKAYFASDNNELLNRGVHDFGRFDMDYFVKISKFKIGDFIIGIGGDILKVVKTNSTGYWLENRNGVKNLMPYDPANDWYNLWSINRAEDGDFIKYNGSIYVFKSLNKDYFTYYCGMFISEEGTCGIYTNSCYQEFTEKDRITLADNTEIAVFLSKLKESGCEWDAMDKKVKRITFKFKVGDIIISDVIVPYQVTDIKDTDYILTPVKVGVPISLPADYVDKTYHLWTIEEDAKPGDVIVITDNHNCKEIGIFKEINGNTVYSYCQTNNDGFWPRENWMHATVHKFSPATKEQQNLLFSRMKKVKYEWDAEKLELKKLAKRWRDDISVFIDGFYIEQNSNIIDLKGGTPNIKENYNIFATEAQAKSALAMARISQIMKNDGKFGGIITDGEWLNESTKYVMVRNRNRWDYQFRKHEYCLLAFHTAEQRDLFLKENEDLVKDYLMIP